MEVFERDRKINFVDENDVFVGFDNEQDCCEDFGWAFLDELPKTCYEAMNQNSIKFDTKDWVFDTAFFKLFNDDECDEETAVVAFKITKGKEHKYLILYNSHNGYYGHGFEMQLSGENIQNGCL